MDLEVVLSLLAPRLRARRLLRALSAIAARDYWVSYGPLSYHLAVRLVKTG
jgi:hypothetical protein